MNNPTTYGKPSIGCYLDHANYGVDELNREIISLAEGYGWRPDDEGRATIDAYDNIDLDEERGNGPDIDLAEQLNDLVDEAVDWLNDQETRPFLYWANEGEANAFGLWPNVEGAKEDCGFVSVKSHADARSLGIETDPDDSAYPSADYRGEWLHVNDHGNCTLYVRNDDGTDTEIWSVV